MLGLDGLPAVRHAVAQFSSQGSALPPSGASTDDWPAHVRVALEPHRQGSSANKITVLAILRSTDSLKKWDQIKNGVRVYISQNSGPFLIIALKDGTQRALDLDEQTCSAVSSNEEQLLAHLSRVQRHASAYSGGRGFDNFLKVLVEVHNPSQLQKVVIFCAEEPMKPTYTQHLNDAGVAVVVVTASAAGHRMDINKIARPKIELGLCMILPEGPTSAHHLKTDIDVVIKVRINDIPTGKELAFVVDESPYFEAGYSNCTVGVSPTDRNLELAVTLECKLKDQYSASNHVALKRLPQSLKVRVLKRSTFSKPKPVLTDFESFALQPRYFLGHMLRPDQQKLNILILGQKGAGKSSFVNSSFFLLGAEYQSLAMNSAEADHVTLGVAEFDASHNDALSDEQPSMPFRFFDTRGVSEQNFGGDEIALLTEGEMPLGVDWAVIDPAGNGARVTRESVVRYRRAVGQVRLNHTPDVVLFLLSPTVLDDQPQMLKFKQVQRAAERSGRQVITAITRMDTASDERERADYLDSCTRSLSIEVAYPLINYTSIHSRRTFEADAMIADLWIALYKAGKDFRTRMDLTTRQEAASDEGSTPTRLYASPPASLSGGRPRMSFDSYAPELPAASFLPSTRSSANLVETLTDSSTGSLILVRERTTSASSAVRNHPRYGRQAHGGPSHSTNSSGLATPAATPPPSSTVGEGSREDWLLREGSRPNDSPHAENRYSEGGLLPSYTSVIRSGLSRDDTAATGSSQQPVHAFSPPESPSSHGDPQAGDIVPVIRQRSSSHSQSTPAAPPLITATSATVPRDGADPSFSSASSLPTPPPRQPTAPEILTEDQFFDRALQVSWKAKELRVQQHVDWSKVHSHTRGGIQYQQAFLRAYDAHRDDVDVFLDALRLATEHMV
ncbi:hypothetical protein HKX48_005799 [Thoreauomyces humboldtii]|nr:hypothetical protein HKX48_005799 [Thoreauomyces humboldtii]